MKKPDISRILELQQLLAAYSQIERVVDIKRGDRFVAETDIEHSYNLAITAMFLAPSFPELDSGKLVRLALVHDFVEVFAGDTYVFAAPEVIATKAQREHDAQIRLKKEWPDFPELHELIEEYEGADTKEAIFIYALDKIMPVMTIFINDGYTWKKEKLTLEKLRWHKDTKVAGSPEINAYYQALIDVLVASPHLIRTPEAKK